MLIDAILLIQDVQLVCFTIIFGFVALQRRDDPVPRWLWYGFLANTAGALLDFASAHTPLWLSRGVNMEMIPLSYVLLNMAVVRFIHRGARTMWPQVAAVLITLPVFLAWSGHAIRFPSDSLIDLTIAVQTLITGILLLCSDERSTRLPRVLMSVFLLAFAAVEFVRAWVAFIMRQDPDVFSKRLETTSAVAYIVSTSVLPLAFIWMMNARLEADLKRQTVLDPLTQVLNRRGLDEVLSRELARYARYGNPLTVALVDLDHFKQLNDTHGHITGDMVLTGVARLLTKFVRRTDTVARMGGEEFVLILPHTGPGPAELLLERVRAGIASYAGQEPEIPVTVTASIGFSTTRDRADVSPTELLREADRALYEAKAAGRNRVQSFSGETQNI